MTHYLIYGPSMQKELGYPAVVSTEGINHISLNLVQSADFIFCFVDGKTEYLKDRYGAKTQYTSEEMLSIALRATTMGRKS
jgi:hypothetical protein